MLSPCGSRSHRSGRRRLSRQSRRIRGPDGAGECGPVTDLVELAHLHRVEDFGAGDLDTLGNRDPVKARLLALRDRVDDKESPDHPRPAGGPR